jgi:putative phosphoribosyl transferase
MRKTPSDRSMKQIETTVWLSGIALPADLTVPRDARGLVLFAHGSGSSRHSPRNRHVADVLNRGQIGTLLVDLLTSHEETVDLQSAKFRFDIPRLGRRLIEITDWIGRQPDLKTLGLGYFGASTGAAAALVGAAHRPNVVKAVVSRGGRPDLAELPTSTGRRLEIVPDATHLFEEPGTLDVVADLATGWFRKYLAQCLASNRY